MGEKGRVVRVRSERAFLKALPEATHALVWNFKAEWFAMAPRLKVLATPGAGRELVPTAAPKGVKLHFGHFHGEIMAETVAGFALAWARGFFRPERTAPGWMRAAMSDKCRMVKDSRAVIVGYGRVGRAIGAKLESLGVRVRGLTHAEGDMLKRWKTADGRLKQAVAEAEWFVMALPSDTGTDDFLDASLIRRLPRTCVVVNVGRGNSVDETALVAALESGRLAGAYLDVFKGEPGPLQSIVKCTKAAGILGTGPEKLPWNLIKTPHSSAFAADYLKRAIQELKDDGCL